MKKLTYLQTTSQMDFLTNLSAPQLGWTYHLKFTPLQLVDWNGDGFPCFFGNVDRGILIRTTAKASTQMRIWYANGGDFTGYYETFGSPIDMYVDRSGVTINGTRYLFSSTADRTPNAGKIYINACCDNKYTSEPPFRRQTAKYEFIGVYDSAGTAVAEYIPVLDDNDVCCFYDKVSGNYIYNGGIGTPISGDIISTIIVSGNNAIDAFETNETLTVASQSDWSASTSASYASFVVNNSLVSAITGTSATTSCTINIQANTGSTERTATFDFVNATVDTANLTVTQKKPYTGSYVFCEWIEGQHGMGGSYLDLGITPSLDMEIEMTVQNSLRTQGSNDARIIGNGESGGFELYSSLEEYCVLDFGDETGIGSDLSILLPNGASKIDIDVTSTGMTRTWNNIQRSTTYTATELTGATETLKLNGISGSFCNAMRYGEIVIKKSGTTVFDGKPCVYGSQVGLYDLVSDTFIAGQGKSFLALNKYGYVMIGGEITESLVIGEDKVDRIYLGDELIYLAASALTPTPPQVQDAISASSIDEGDNQFSIYGSFTSATYDSIWECQIDAQTYIDAIDMGYDPDDIDWVKSQGWHNQGVTATTNTTFDFESFLITENYCHYYAFLYDSVNDVISNTYYYEYFGTASALYCTSTSNQAGDYIDIGQYVDDDTVVEVKGMWKDIYQGDTVVGYLNGYDYANGWRFFNAGDVYLDWAENRINTSSLDQAGGLYYIDCYTSGVTFDFTLNNYSIYDNDSQLTLASGSSVSDTYTGDTINVDVGTIWIQTIKIYRNNVLVFDGEAKNDGTHIGIYDNIGEVMHYNSELTMTTGEFADNPATPSEIEPEE